MKRIVERLDFKTFVPNPKFLNQKNQNYIDRFRDISNGKSDYITLDDPISSGNDLLVGDVDRYGFEIPYVLNVTSGIIRAQKYYNKTILNSFYNSYYREIYTFGSYGYARLYAEQILLGEKIFSLIADNNLKITSVLDIGTGVGGALLSFKSAGAYCEGIDLNNDSVVWGRDHSGSNLSTKSLSDLLNENKKFDLIILNHVIEHVLPINEFMTSVKALLSSSGVIYISVPSIEVVFRWYQSDLGNYFQNAHIWNFSIRSYLLFLEHHQLKPIYMNNNIDSLVTIGEGFVPEDMRMNTKYEIDLLLKTEELYRYSFKKGCFFAFLLANLSQFTKKIELYRRSWLERKIRKTIDDINSTLIGFNNVK
jgi:2-polyprenyl-3-methyl-5-hydroxy-6-metoxy-1,4-benzoquinol methylase